MSRTMTLCLLSLLCLLLAAPAAADPAGEKVLRQMDKAFTRAKDQHFLYTLTTQEPGKPKRVLKLDVRIKGENWRFIEFLAPGDVKGMKVLVRAANKMYVYMPAYRKVRRVASHAKEQGFMGTTFGNDEISSVAYSPSYKAKLLKETKTHWYLQAERREGAEVRYGKLEFDVLKKYEQPSEIRYFNDKGVKIKTEKRTEYSCQGKICNAGKMRMIDHVRNDAWSEFDRLEWEVNTGVSDRVFSLRNLQRAR